MRLPYYYFILLFHKLVFCLLVMISYSTVTITFTTMCDKASVIVCIFLSATVFFTLGVIWARGSAVYFFFVEKRATRVNNSFFKLNKGVFVRL